MGDSEEKIRSLSAEVVKLSTASTDLNAKLMAAETAIAEAERKASSRATEVFDAVAARDREAKRADALVTELRASKGQDQPPPPARGISADQLPMTLEHFDAFRQQIEAGRDPLPTDTHLQVCEKTLKLLKRPILLPSERNPTSPKAFLEPVCYVLLLAEDKTGTTLQFLVTSLRTYFPSGGGIVEDLCTLINGLGPLIADYILMRKSPKEMMDLLQPQLDMMYQKVTLLTGRKNERATPGGRNQRLVGDTPRGGGGVRGGGGGRRGGNRGNRGGGARQPEEEEPVAAPLRKKPKRGG